MAIRAIHNYSIKGVKLSHEDYCWEATNIITFVFLAHLESLDSVMIVIFIMSSKRNDYLKD